MADRNVGLGVKLERRQLMSGAFAVRESNNRVTLLVSENQDLEQITVRYWFIIAIAILSLAELSA